METQKAKISKFSKLICIAIKIVLVIFIIVGVIQVLSWIVIKFNIPYIFKLGDMRIMLPVIPVDGIEAVDSLIPDLLRSDLSSILQTVSILIILSFARRFFGLLVNDGTPFRAEVVKALHKMAVVFLVLGLFSGLTGLIAAGVVYVLSLIFNYGFTLQNESDTTL